MKKNQERRRHPISIKLLLQFVVMLFAGGTASANDIDPNNYADPAIEGRWDITINENGKEIPSWLEVNHSGHHTFIGHFVGAGGSARPISRVNFSDGKISFTLPPQWEEESNDISVEGTLTGQTLAGKITASDGKTFNWVGVRAPSLRRTQAPVWGKQIKLFSGTDLKGWHAMGTNQWVAKNGILTSPHSGANLVTDQSFKDFKLHIEFRYPKGSNSGVYLRGRYEVQVSDSKGKEPLKDELGAIYGFISPNEQVAKEAGEWQTYDITLVGRIVTVVANGKKIICEQEIPGITGGAIDSKEGEPGPILIQGDHGPIEYRNILLTPAK